MESKDSLSNYKRGAYIKFQPPKLTTLGLISTIVTSALISTNCKSSNQEQEDQKKLELSGIDFTQEGLFKAAAQDNLEALKTFKAHNFDFAATDLLGRTAVHAAADSGAIRSLTYLKANGASLETADHKKTTPLMLAAQNGQLEAIQYLLKSKVPSQVIDSQKKFALIHAIDSNTEQAIRLIAPHNREYLDTALLYAADQNKANAIEPLIQYGASVYARNAGETSLMIAGKRGHHKVAEELLQHGANPFAVSETGKLARDYAMENNHDKFIEVLESASLSTSEDDILALEWSEEELEEVVRNAMERYHEEDIEEIIATEYTIEKSDNGTVTKLNLPTPIEAPQEVTVTPIQGHSIPAKLESHEVIQETISMVTYAQKPLPLILNAKETGNVEVTDIRKSTSAPVKVTTGSSIGTTGLKVTEIKKKIVNSKMTGGRDEELVTLTIHDEQSGQSREIFSGYESVAADAVAIVKLKEQDDFLLVRRGDTFTDNTGTSFTVEDVNEREVIVQNMQTHEVSLLPLLGIEYQ